MRVWCVDTQNGVLVPIAPESNFKDFEEDMVLIPPYQMRHWQSIEKGEDLVGYSSCKYDGAYGISASKRFEGSYDIDSAVKRV